MTMILVEIMTSRTSFMIEREKSDFRVLVRMNATSQLLSCIVMPRMINTMVAPPRLQDNM